MARRVKHLITPEITVGAVTEFSDLAAIPVFEAEYADEWEPEDAVEHWTEWTIVSSVEDRDPTYSPEYFPQVSLFRTPLLKQLHPHRKRTVTFERHLLRRWVDREQGPMGQKVRTETRTERY